MKDGQHAGTASGVGVSPEDRYTQYDYDDINRNLLVTDRNGTRTLTDFDALGRLTRLVENESGTDATADTQTLFGYDGVRQTSITDHDGNTTQYVYDAALRLAQAIYPDSHDGHNVAYFGYDAAGNLMQRTDQRGIVTTYAYNDLHLLRQRQYGGAAAARVEELEFDRSGRLLSARKVATGGGYANQADFAYDAAGRMESALQTYADSTQYPLGYAYTVGVGDVHADLEYPSGRVATNTFDRRSRLESVFDGLGNGVQWTFDAGNRRVAAALSNGAASMFAYDLNNRLLQIQHGSDVGAALDPFYDVAYGYDPVGNRLFKQDFERPNRNEVYSYDQRHRLTLDTAPAASRPGSRSDPRASHATPCQGLTRFRRGTIAFDGEGAAGIVTPINDPQMPSFRLPGPTRPTRRAQARREHSRTACRSR